MLFRSTHASVVRRLFGILSFVLIRESDSSPSHLAGLSNSSNNLTCAAFFLPNVVVDDRSSSSNPTGKSGPCILVTTSENVTFRDCTANSLYACNGVLGDDDRRLEEVTEGGELCGGACMMAYWNDVSDLCWRVARDGDLEEEEVVMEADADGGAIREEDTGSVP